MKGENEMILNNVNLSLLDGIDLFDILDLLNKVKDKYDKNDYSGKHFETYVFNFDEYFASQYEDFEKNLTIHQCFKLLSRIVNLNMNWVPSSMHNQVKNLTLRKFTQ